MASPPRYATHGAPPGPRLRTPLLVGGTVVLVAVVVLGALLLSGRIWGHQTAGPSTATTPQVTVSTAPSTAPTTAPTTVPTTQPGAVPTALPGFGAAALTGGSPDSGTVTVASVRAAAQSGYDRFVIDFGTSPLKNLSYQVTPQDTPTFTNDPKGDQVTLQGSRGVQIAVSSIANWTALPGSTDLNLGLPAIKQAKLTGDFEGYVHWSLGVDGPGFIRVMTLTNPTRLAVDVQT